MGWNEAYDSLLELFPQIDARVLKAVAIEHGEDVDTAVESVLEEIIPFFVEKSEPSSPLTRAVSVGESSEAPVGAIFETPTVDDPFVNTFDSAELQNGYNVNHGNQQLFHGSGDEPNEPFYDAYDGHRQGGDNTADLTLSGKNHGNGMKMTADVCSHSKSVVLIDLNVVDTFQIEVSGAPETEEMISEDKCSGSSSKISSDKIPQHTLGMVQDFDQIKSLIEEGENISGQLETDIGKVGSKENDASVRPLESSTQLFEMPYMHESNLEKLEVSLLNDTVSDSNNMSDTVVIENDSTLSVNMSKSGQIHIMEVVEEIIADAKNNKKTLFTAMESVISLMRQVELKEQDIEQAKEEASVGGKNILHKVEELEQMLAHAKEANDMHAGEVYGEKAVLATELRELQARVLSLSDERDKSLAVLDEMSQTLEVRLAAAEDKLKSVEHEKLEKENAARKLLQDQELIMEKVVQESKILRQQAEDNAKLQEFLVDRGRIVDMLQGEIAVICQDVRVLMEKFDEHVPLSKSLFSSQTSFILAASNSSSSSKSLNPDQMELVPVGDDLSETQKKEDHEKVSEEESNRDDRKALADDGWDFFDAHETNA